MIWGPPYNYTLRMTSIKSVVPVVLSEQSSWVRNLKCDLEQRARSGGVWELSGGRDWVQRSVGQSDPNLNRNCISLAKWSQHQQSCYSAMQIQQHYYRLLIDQSCALLLLLSDRLLESLCWWIRDIDPRPRLLSVRALLRITNTGR